MTALSGADLKTLDIVYRGTPAVFVEAKTLSSSSLDIVYQGTPFFGYPVSADVSFTLTGLVTTASVGSLSRATASALTGQSVTGNTGTVVPIRDKSLAGINASIALGVVSVVGGTVYASLTGVSVSASSSTLTPLNLNSLTGSNPLGLALSSLVGLGSRTLIGQLVSSSNGTLTVNITNDLTLALSGQILNLATGTLSASTLKTLLGLGTSSVISAPTVFNVITGQAITGSLGNLTALRSFTLSGNSSALSSQALQAEIPRVLAGLSLVGATSSFSVVRSVSLSGQLLTVALATLFKNSGSVEWVIYEQNPDQIIVASRDSKLLIELKNNILVITQE